eukprot:6415165-Alexandrium_andersonii.AAC.2
MALCARCLGCMAWPASRSQCHAEPWSSQTQYRPALGLLSSRKPSRFPQRCVHRSSWFAGGFVIADVVSGFWLHGLVVSSSLFGLVVGLHVQVYEEASECEHPMS